MPAMTALTRDYLKQLMAYIDHKLNAPERLVLGGGAGAEGGSGVPPGGVLGQLAQRYVCYDTTEATTSGSTTLSGSSPSLIQNLNRIRGGWAIGDEAIRERHMFWSTACLAGSSGSIDAYHIPFFSSVGNPEDNVRDAIDWVYGHRTDVVYTWHTFMFSVEGQVGVATGALQIAAPGDFTIDHVYLRCETAPTGSAIIVDVNKNGTTIFTTQANRPQVSAGANSGTSGTPDITALELDDYLTFDVDQVGSVTPGSNLTVHVRCKQYAQV